MASSQPQQQITVTDKLALLPVLGRTLASVLLRLLTTPFISGSKAKSTFRDVVFAALRTQLGSIPASTEQWLMTSTESNYLDFAKKANFQPDTTVLESGLKLHWLGPKSAEKVVLYFHGGGYVLSCDAGHFQWLFDLQNEVAKGRSVAVVVVGYTLAPHGQYPKQLQEAAEALEWLLESHGKKASDIIIAGDSAGGNMALSLMSHLLHPHEQVKQKISLSEPLAGAILISPWAKFATDDASVERNLGSDMLHPNAARRWGSAFMGSGQLDNYNQPILADKAWFGGLDGQVNDILVWGGGGEVLIDSIEVVAKKLKDAHPRTEVVVEPGAAHEGFIIDVILGYKGKAEATKLIESWIMARV